MLIINQVEENEVVVESASEEEDHADKKEYMENASSEIRELLSKKMELEKQRRSQELHRVRAQVIYNDLI